MNYFYSKTINIYLVLTDELKGMYMFYLPYIFTNMEGYQRKSTYGFCTSAIKGFTQNQVILLQSHFDTHL